MVTEIGNCCSIIINLCSILSMLITHFLVIIATRIFVTRQVIFVYLSICNGSI